MPSHTHTMGTQQCRMEKRVSSRTFKQKLSRKKRVQFSRRRHCAIKHTKQVLPRGFPPKERRSMWNIEKNRQRKKTARSEEILQKKQAAMSKKKHPSLESSIWKRNADVEITRQAKVERAAADAYVSVSALHAGSAGLPPRSFWKNVKVPRIILWAEAGVLPAFSCFSDHPSGSDGVSRCHLHLQTNVVSLRCSGKSSIQRPFASSAYSISLGAKASEALGANSQTKTITTEEALGNLQALRHPSETTTNTAVGYPNRTASDGTRLPLNDRTANFCCLCPVGVLLLTKRYMFQTPTCRGNEDEAEQEREGRFSANLPR